MEHEAPSKPNEPPDGSPSHQPIAPVFHGLNRHAQDHRRRYPAQMAMYVLDHADGLPGSRSKGVAHTAPGRRQATRTTRTGHYAEL